MSRPISIEEMVKTFKSRHKTTHLFKIDNFSLLKKYKIKEVESSIFELGGHKMKLIVYPKGNKNDNGKGYISIYVEFQGSGNTWFTFQVFVVSQLLPFWHNKGTMHISTAITKKWGTPRLISLEDLETAGYLIDDCCMFGVKLFGIQEAESGTAECFSLIEKPLNYRVTWLITKFSSFRLAKHTSNEFVVGTRKWRIELYPKGNQSGEGKALSVYLLGDGFINNEPKTKTFAKFKLRVLNQVNKNHFEQSTSYWFDAEPFDFGFPEFMPLEELDEPYLVKDKLSIGVEFEVISMIKYC